MNDPLPEGIYLHVGCGSVAPSRWMNLDASWNLVAARVKGLRPLMKALHLISPEAAAQAWPPNIHFHDITRGLPLQDRQAAVIYASHVLEHLTRSQAKSFARESYRILKTGGVLRIVVPDLETLARRYLEANDFPPNGDDSLPADQFLKMLNTCRDYGRVNPVLRVYRSYNDVHTHKWMYDVPSLKRLLVEAGFATAEPKGYLDSIIPLVSEVEKEQRFEHGICIEARK